MKSDKRPWVFLDKGNSLSRWSSSDSKKPGVKRSKCSGGRKTGGAGKAKARSLGKLGSWGFILKRIRRRWRVCNRKKWFQIYTDHGALMLPSAWLNLRQESSWLQPPDLPVVRKRILPFLRVFTLEYMLLWILSLPHGDVYKSFKKLNENFFVRFTTWECLSQEPGSHLLEV